MNALQARSSTRGSTAASTSASGNFEGGTIKGNVPQFLAKLWNMVNDPTNDHLIKWSDNGQSFYILDQDRFAKEVLGNFYKTENVQSFVRQLNMYGFHKIQHIRQGAMRTSKESQAWQFTNPNFQRGQPDLLCLIARKNTKNPDKAGIQNGAGGAASIEALDGLDFDNTRGQALGMANGLGEIAMSGAKSPGANLNAVDVPNLMGGLATIKRHQAVISATLKEVQQNNQALWQEALEARERHRKHQDTINRILKFLASLYQGAGGPHSAGIGGGGGNPAEGAVVPVARPRLMITESGEKRPSKKKDDKDDQSNIALSDLGTPSVRLEELLGDDIPQPSTPLSFAVISPIDTPSGLPFVGEQKSPSVARKEKSPQTQASAPLSTDTTPAAKLEGDLLSPIPSNETSTPQGKGAPTLGLDAWNPAAIQRMFQLYPGLTQSGNFQLPIIPSLAQQGNGDTSMALTAPGAHNLGYNPFLLYGAMPQNPQLLMNGVGAGPAPPPYLGNIFDPNSTAPVPNSGFLPNSLDVVPAGGDATLHSLAQNSQRLQQINQSVDQLGAQLDGLLNNLPTDDTNPVQDLTLNSGDNLDFDAFWRQLGGLSTNPGELDGASLAPPNNLATGPMGDIDPMILDSLLPDNGARIHLDPSKPDSLIPPGLGEADFGDDLANGRLGKKRKSDAAELGTPSVTSKTAPKTKKRK